MPFPFLTLCNNRILDKFVASGGRFATRRLTVPSTKNNAIPFDTGCQTFTAVSPQFKAITQEWNQKNWIQKWSPYPSFLRRHKHQPNQRNQHEQDLWVAVDNGMVSLPRYLSQDLSISYQERIRHIRNGPNQVELVTEGGNSFTADAVVVAIPVQQLMNDGLLESGFTKSTLEKLRTVRYDPCFSLQVMLKPTTKLLQNRRAILESILDPANKTTYASFGSMKPGLLKKNIINAIDNGIETLTVHFELDNSISYSSIEPDILSTLLPKLHNAFRAASAPLDRGDILLTNLKKWRYAIPKTFIDESSLLDNRVVFIGDAFGQGADMNGIAGNVERAVLSAIDGAEKTLDIVK